MAQTIELTVPDLGGFEDVPIIEVLIASGDRIGKDAPLVTLESDKATMEVPATAAGVVRDVKVKIGDRVSTGSVLANVEVADDAAPAPAAAVPSAPVSAAAGAVAPASAASGNEAAELAHAEAADSGGGTADLIVPDIGDFADVPVISVFIKAGDTIAKDAPLVELESDKATMEVPALCGGVVRDVLVKVGDKVSQGTVLARVGTPTGPATASPANGQPAQAPVERAPEPKQPAPALAAIVAPAPPSANGNATAGGSAVLAGPVHASPAIRRFARELGVNLHGVTGSGPNGRVTRDDVQQYVKRTLAARATGAPAAPAGGGGGLTVLPWPKIDFEKFGPIERVPVSRIAKISGANLARNWVMIPHVTQQEDADVTELEEFRKTLNAEHKDVKVTMLALLMKAVVAALRRFPNFNSSLDGDDLVLKRYFHLGFAADTPAGLVVPVIRDVDKKGVLELATETSALAKKARDGKLGPADMSGSGFTISSLGGIGGTSFTPIINAPEVAILGVSRSAFKPVWDGKAFAPRLILPLSLSYDHRVIDGAAAARFCAHLAGLLADMRKTLL
jgi:pyruvate dehydrogenase E2 component (dihydrolipoamide acetyltransferase)